MTFRLLLIVPYGIETSTTNGISLKQFLLIVPYGIETWIGANNKHFFYLLIVPYGIETCTYPYRRSGERGF